MEMSNNDLNYVLYFVDLCTYVIQNVSNNSKPWEIHSIIPGTGRFIESW